MNILIFNGSPRKRGNTDLLLAKVGEGVQQAGRHAEHISLAHLSIHPCTGCGHCETEGFCIINDDMTALYDKLATAHRIVLGSPIYFYGITAQAKAFIDRCQALWCRKYLLGETRPDRENLRGYFVSVAATAGGKVFEGAGLTVRYAYDAMDFSYAGELLVQGVDRKGSIAEREDDLRKALQLGMEICQRA